MRKVVHVDGRLAGEAVAELERVCRSVKESLVLDLARLLSIDEWGIERFGNSRSRGPRSLARAYIKLMPRQ